MRISRAAGHLPDPDAVAAWIDAAGAEPQEDAVRAWLRDQVPEYAPR